MQIRGVALAVGVLGTLLLVGLAIYLATVGLSQADQWGSVISAFAGLVAVGLATAALARTASPNRDAGATGVAPLGSDRVEPAVPRQLVAAPARFTGRAAELDALSAALAPERAGTGSAARPAGARPAIARPAIAAICGLGGMGKTWLALHWAHLHAGRFPDGQLFADLRGFSRDEKPTPPAVVIRGLLPALGVDPARVPTDPDEGQRLYRSLLADRRMLILLDNAARTEQVAPLLPAAGGCTVLVTSRRHLDGLVTTHGAHPLELSPMPEVDGRRLLVGHLGAQRVDAEPDAVAELLRFCAGLPLGLSIVAARAARHPAFPLATLAAELRDRATRLDGLDAGELTLNLRAAFALSSDALPPAAATLLALLGVAPGPEIGLPATASLIGATPVAARGLLAELEAAHLVEQRSPGRFRMHDLLRIYAAEQAGALPPAELDGALRRLVDFYLHTAHSAARLQQPLQGPPDPDPPAAGCRPERLPDEDAAWDWLAAEHECLLASQRLAAGRGWHRAAWQLAWALHSFHFRRAHHVHWLATWELGLEAARRDGNPTAVRHALLSLGRACFYTGRHAEALEHAREALRLAEDSGDLESQAQCHGVLSAYLDRPGQRDRAYDHAVTALRLARAADEPLKEVDMLNAVGWFATQLGRHEEARECCEAALALVRRLPAPPSTLEASILDSLGMIALNSGRTSEAIDLYRQSVARSASPEVKDALSEAETRTNLGQVLNAAGDARSARAEWLEALALFQRLRYAGRAAAVQQLLDQLDGKS